MTVQSEMRGDLLPCPFCESEAWLRSHGSVLHDSPMGIGHRVECEGACHAMTCYWHTKAEAIAAWNRRPEHASPPVEAMEAARRIVEDAPDIDLMRARANLAAYSGYDEDGVREQFDALLVASALLATVKHE